MCCEWEIPFCGCFLSGGNTFIYLPLLFPLPLIDFPLQLSERFESSESESEMARLPSEAVSAHDACGKSSLDICVDSCY